MTVTRKAGAAILGSVLLAGCHHQQTAEPPAPEAMPQAVGGDARASLQRLAPNAQIGRVIAVYHEEGLVAVGEVAVKDFRKGDVVTFIGGEEAPLANGVVIAIVKDALHVEYVPAEEGGRRPEAGDLAIRFGDLRR